MKLALLVKVTGYYEASMYQEGKGYVTKKGYRRVMYQGRLRMEHCIIWEINHGPIPKGMQIHHIDENKLNNNIENLQLVTPLEHKRIHSTCQVKDGVEQKRCAKCGEYKPTTGEYYYFTARGWIASFCKKCVVKSVTERRSRRIALGWKRPHYPKKQ